MPQGWDFPKGSIYGSFISDFNRNKVRPALRPFESQLTYFAYLDCKCFRAGLCLPLHLLLSTTAAQADVGERVCLSRYQDYMDRAGSQSHGS